MNGGNQMNDRNPDMEFLEKGGTSQPAEAEQTGNGQTSAKSRKKSGGGQYSAREAELIRQFVQARLEQKEELEFEKLDDYEVPPRTQFPMLKKPALTIKFGFLKFNMACIRLFEGVQFIIPSINRKKHRIAALMCYEEEGASVEWARQKNGQWVNKDIRSDDYTKKVFDLMTDWRKECRYKVLGRVTQSKRGLILVFDLDEAIKFEPKPEEYTDPETGEVKKRQVKYYPEYYRNRIGRYYDDYAAAQQLNMFEQLEDYSAGGDQDQPLDNLAPGQESISQEQNPYRQE